ncbi:MAG: hypothetical protein ACPKPY_07020 [Nitrososphaeraceae archaeon]
MSNNEMIKLLKIRYDDIYAKIFYKGILNNSINQINYSDFKDNN